MSEVQNQSVGKDVGKEHGFTARQWAMLLFTFVLGIASVLTVDKVFLSHAPHSGTVQAAVAQP